MLFPKQFSLQKVVTFAGNAVEKPPTEQSPVVKIPNDFKDIKTKRKLARKQRRSRSKTPPKENNARNNSSILQMDVDNGICMENNCLGTGMMDEVNKFQSRYSVDRISMLATKDDHTHQYPSDSILPTAVEANHELLNHSSSTQTLPSLSTAPTTSILPPPPFPTASEEYYSSQHMFPLPPHPIIEAEEHNGHQNLLISPDYPPPPTPNGPFQSFGTHFSVNDDNELLNPIEQFKRTTKRFQRECRRLCRLNTFEDEKSQARTIAEQAKKGGSKNDDEKRKKFSNDETLVRQGL
jgi:hypothetical protein